MTFVGLSEFVFSYQPAWSLGLYTTVDWVGHIKCDRFDSHVVAGGRGRGTHMSTDGIRVKASKGVSASHIHLFRTRRILHVIAVDASCEWVGLHG